MNIRDLEYLVALAETLHFRKASEKCFVSQPGLSGQIKKLEEHLGVQLVERTNRKVLFTPVGKEVARRANRILAEVRELEEVAKSFENPMQGPLQLGIIPTLAPYLVPRLIGPMKERYPALELYLHELQTEHLLVELKEGQLDLGLLAFPLEENLQQIPLFEEEFLLAVSSSHPLSTKKQVDLEDLQTEEVLLMGEGHCFRDHALDICHQANAQENPYFKANSIEILRQMVAYGGGITLMPKLSIQDNHQTMNSLIHYIPFRNPAPKRLIGMVYRPGCSRGSGFNDLGALIQQVFMNKLGTLMLAFLCFGCVLMGSPEVFAQTTNTSTTTIVTEGDREFRGEGQAKNTDTATQGSEFEICGHHQSTRCDHQCDWFRNSSISSACP